MRAVNLIPADARSGGGGAAGRSGGLVYVLLGGLVGLTALAAVYALTTSGISSKRSQLAQLHTQVADAQARVTGQASPQDLAQVRATRSQAVKALAQARFDWAQTLDSIGRTLPANVTLTMLDAAPGTVTAAAPAPAPAPGGTATTTTPAAPAAPPVVSGPTIALTGCSPTQRGVAELMPRLRVVPGVTDVELSSSTLGTSGSGAPPPGQTSTTACAGATFQLTVTLSAPTGAAPSAPTASSTPAPAASSTPPNTATTVSGPAPGATR